MNRKAAEEAERLRKNWSGPMTEAEIGFLKDIQGFIEFGIRNGLTFPMVMSGLLQDMNEIVREGFDYERACARGFQPQVAKYSKLTGDEFGENEEEEPPH